MTRHWRSLDLTFYAAAASLLLSALAVATRRLVPNSDTYTYLRTTDIFLEQGLLAAFSHYPWATYSVLIGLLHQLTGLEPMLAAQVINALFYLLLTVVFIQLVREIDPSYRVSLIAAVTILIYPHLNDFRDHLIRDIGFLALTLLGMLHLIRYYRLAAAGHAAAFCAGTLAAALFRPEALLFLVLGPFALLYNPRRTSAQRWRQFGTTQGLALLVGLIGFLAFLLFGVNLFHKLIDVISVYAPFLYQSGDTLFRSPARVGEAIFTDHAAQFSDRYISLLLVTGLSAILLVKILESFGLWFSLVLAYGFVQRLCRVPRHVLMPAMVYLITAMVVLLGFILIARFMTTRYTMLFCTVLVLLVPVIVDRAWTMAQQQTQTRRFAWIVSFVALYSLVDAHTSLGEAKTYLPEASRWLARNTPASAPFISNEPYLAWASGRIEEYDRINRQLKPETISAAPPGSVLALEVRDEELAALLQQAQASGKLELLSTFDDRRGPRIFVYRKLK